MSLSSLHIHIKVRWVIYLLLALAGIMTILVVVKVQAENRRIQEQETQLAQNQQLFTAALDKYKVLSAKVKEAKDAGIILDETVAQLTVIRGHFLDKQYAEAERVIEAAIIRLDEELAKKKAADQAAADAEAKRLAEEAARLADIEKNKGTITGTIKEGGVAVASASVSVLSGNTTVLKVTSDRNGLYTAAVSPGTYSLTISKSGYTTFRQYNVAVATQKATIVDIILSKVPPAAAVSTNDSTGNSSYSRITVATSRGSYLADVMTFNLASGGIRVKTDTVSDSECTNNCPVASLSTLVSRNGGFAGMNGTYFCPADYASCAGQTGSFFWKVYNSRLGKMINQNNGLGEADPFIAVNSSGVARYFHSWSAGVTSGFSIYAGMNSKPALVAASKNVLNESLLDDKQRTTKSNRGALGLKGQTFYAVIAKGASVPDLAAVMEALGVEYALNVDGGGSSAMIYKGSYKVGPGRSIPNAIIFVGQ